jgi:hypothetical protein
LYSFDYSELCAAGSKNSRELSGSCSDRNRDYFALDQGFIFGLTGNFATDFSPNFAFQGGFAAYIAHMKNPAARFRAPGASFHRDEITSAFDQKSQRVRSYTERIAYSPAIPARNAFRYFFPDDGGVLFTWLNGVADDEGFALFLSALGFFFSLFFFCSRLAMSISIPVDSRQF